MEGVSGDFSKQLSNFVTSLINLSPSRNYIAQFLYIIKMNGGVDYRVMEGYSDILKDKYNMDAISKAFGVSFGERISLDRHGYGWILTDFIDQIFDLFEDNEFRTKVSALLKDEYPQGVPNLRKEWLEVRLRGLSSEPTYGRNAIKILKEILRLERATSEDLEKALGLSRGEIIQCFNLLDLYKLAIKDFDGKYKPSDTLKKYHSVLKSLQVE